MKRVVLAYPWTAPDGTPYEPEDVVELEDDVAKDLVRDGKARPADAPVPAIAAGTEPTVPQKSARVAAPSKIEE